MASSNKPHFVELCTADFFQNWSILTPQNRKSLLRFCTASGPWIFEIFAKILILPTTKGYLIFSLKKHLYAYKKVLCLNFLLLWTFFDPFLFGLDFCSNNRFIKIFRHGYLRNAKFFLYCRVAYAYSNMFSVYL